MYEQFNKEIASTEDRIAWVLCQIIDDDAPMRWTRYRFAAECIAKNPELMADLMLLGKIPAHAVVEAVPLNFDQLQKVMSKHFGGRELTDDEADSAEAFARAIERAHGIGDNTP